MVFRGLARQRHFGRAVAHLAAFAFRPGDDAEFTLAPARQAVFAQCAMGGGGDQPGQHAESQRLQWGFLSDAVCHAPCRTGWKTHFSQLQKTSVPPLDAAPGLP